MSIRKQLAALDPSNAVARTMIQKAFGELKQTLVSDVFTIEHTRFRPKPDTYGFLRLCRGNHLRPQRCIMVEDSLENLRTAKRLGMKTVWVSEATRVPAFVDARLSSIRQLPRMLDQLQ